LYDGGQSDEIILDMTMTAELIMEGYAREVMRQIQDLRKEAKYQLDEKVNVAWKSENTDLVNALQKFGGDIARDTLLKEFARGRQAKIVFDIEKESEVAKGVGIWIGIKK